jgi:ketol-acid reductoisomerase
MTVTYFEDSANPDLLAGTTLGVIGYNDVGRAFALNLRDSGFRVVACSTDADQRAALELDGITTDTLDAIVQQTSVMLLTADDDLLPELYMQHISPRLARGKTLLFASGYNVAFGFIEPPPFVDVGLIAPRATGASMRAAYMGGDGVVSFVAVAQDASRQAWPTLLAVTHGAGLLRAGAIEISFEQEPRLSLFIQQAIIPVFYDVMVTAASVLMESGYAPEAVLTDLYLSGKFSDYVAHVQREGLLSAILQSPLPQQYATLSRLERFRELKLERLMEVTLREITNTAFSKELAQELIAGLPRFAKLRKTQESLDLWDWEQQTLDMLERDDL